MSVDDLVEGYQDELDLADALEIIANNPEITHGDKVILRDVAIDTRFLVGKARESDREKKKAEAKMVKKMFYKLEDVMEITSLSGSSIYRMAKLGTFPPIIKLGDRASGWLISDVHQWIDDRIAESRAN